MWHILKHRLMLAKLGQTIIDYLQIVSGIILLISGLHLSYDEEMIGLFLVMLGIAVFLSGIDLVQYRSRNRKH